MAQAELFDIDSPCISVCEMDDKGYCKGCLRNRTERQLWHMMNDEQKRQVLRLLFIRRQKQKTTAAKLAKQAIFGEGSMVFSQMTFLETLEVGEQRVEKAIEVQIFPSPSVVVSNSQPVSKIASNEARMKDNIPKTSAKSLKNTEDIKEQNWDFFAILDQSLQG